MKRNSAKRIEKNAARKVVRLRGAGRTIVLGITGSIAAYKSAELASLLVKQGHNVFAVMTHDAAEFITPLTLQTLSKNPVMSSFFDEKDSVTAETATQGFGFVLGFFPAQSCKERRVAKSRRRSPSHPACSVREKFPG